MMPTVPADNMLQAALASTDSQRVPAMAGAVCDGKSPAGKLE